MVISSILTCSINELNLRYSLTNGQAFRWRSNPEKSKWTGVIGKLVFSLQQDDIGNLLYTVHNPDNLDIKDSDQILEDYFQLKTSLTELYKEWSEMDEVIAKVIPKYPGVRTLRIDPVENLFTFICSSNNNIGRITQMVNNLCIKFGSKLTTVDDVDYFSFPEIEILSGKNVANTLRELNFGYRAKYIQKAAEVLLKEGGSDWLFGLRKQEYSEAKSKLLKIPGVGPKVSDCICLMSLDKTESLPVDTHVFQLVSKYYIPKLRNKKVNINVGLYKEIGDHMRKTWGKHAGWAQTVMFTSDLKNFQTAEESDGKKVTKEDKTEEEDEPKIKKQKRS
ncbi:DgyrCDS10473 [Dimorphilus gyrociliatus]|uniref:N-glycosylase/DNA lyase n=1 Tax=Dimorphilus gyrociliatus TaxID=2664684 RepID=A0A7I8W094_9ANNE|nr:DgyrCDS10473 [Dimorphilus gyrociliatus]